MVAEMACRRSQVKPGYLLSILVGSSFISNTREAVQNFMLSGYRAKLLVCLTGR